MFLFSTFSFSLQVFLIDWRTFFACFPSVSVATDTCDQYKMYIVDTVVNYCVYVLKFRVCEHDIPCALEKIVIMKKVSMRSFALQPVKTLYLKCHVAYVLQNWQGG